MALPTIPWDSFGLVYLTAVLYSYSSTILRLFVLSAGETRRFYFILVIDYFLLQ